MPVTLQSIIQKILSLFQSRKFYALITALILDAQQYAQGKIDPFQFLIVAVGALSAYALASGIEDAGRGSPDRGRMVPGGDVSPTPDAP